MSTVKIVKKPFGEKGQVRRQTTWIRSEEKLKHWRKGSTNQPKLTHRHSGISTERKSDVTRSGRLSDGTVNSVSTGSSETSLPRLQDVEDVEQKESIEKCLKWMQTLPEKFTGMHIFVQPSSGDIS